MAETAQVAEASASALVTEEAPAEVAEASASVLATIQSPANVAEASVSVLTSNAAAMGAGVAEASVSALTYVATCTTQRCDLWKITRTDGVIFAFTSLDSDILFEGIVYQHCASLQDTATESSSEAGSVASVELTGLIDADAISEEELYGGLFDDAFVECWVMNWNANNADSQTPFRVASGWIGKVTRGQASFTAEVQGAGARLQQSALVDFYTPGCRWQFGDSRCSIDAAALTEHALSVTGAVGRAVVNFAPQAIPPQTALWNDGLLVWTYGANAGIKCQTETVDWESGILTLWDLAPFPPQPGDGFDLVPGCSYDSAGCIVYDNLINFGGFPNVPGPDALQQNADSLFTGANG